jgi:hypothetical protein
MQNVGQVRAEVRRRFPTLDHAWLFTAIALIAMRPLMMSIPPHDFWWHMATGRFIVETGAIPTTDQFSYTQAGEPFYNQSWLAQVLLYALHEVGGVALIVLVQAVVIALAYGLLLLLCIRRSGAIRLSVAVLLLTTMPVSFDNWNVRPQSYAFPLFAAFLLILTMWRLGSSRPRLWVLPLLMLLWVNLHGSFILGGGLIALMFVGEWGRRVVQDRWSGQAVGVRPALRPLFLWGVVTALAMLVNPRGVEVLGYVFNLLNTSAVTTLVTEWAPPSFTEPGGMIFFAFLAAFVVVLVTARRWPDVVDIVLLLPFLFLALRATRNVVWFGFVATPVLVVQLRRRLDALPGSEGGRRFQGVPLMNGVVMGFVAFLLVLTLPWVKPHLGLPPAVGNLIEPYTPVEAVEVLKDYPQRPEHLYHAMSYGSYLIWAAPGQPVFADPRIELYPYEQWQDYIQLNAGNNVQQLLDKYAIDGMLLSKEEQGGLLEVMRGRAGWEVVYEDEWSTLLVVSR